MLYVHIQVGASTAQASRAYCTISWLLTMLYAHIQVWASTAQARREDEGTSVLQYYGFLCCTVADET